MAEHDEGWVEEEEEDIDEMEVAIDEVLEEFIPKILSETIDILNGERDTEVLQELQQSLKATEVPIIKEALREADIHNLNKTNEADAVRAWLIEIQNEIAVFDLIREQRKITSELDGSTHLLKLIGKAYDQNLQYKPKRFKSSREMAGRGKAELDNSNLALRMGGQDASQHFALDAYEQDEEDEMELDQQYGDEVMVEYEDEEEEEEEAESEDSEEGYGEIEDAFWDQLDDSDDEDEEGGAKKIDVLALWRMRVPRHTKLLKDCVIHLGKCTQRLDATADKIEIASLFKRLRYLCTAGDRRAMVELIVVTEVMHLPLEDPSLGNQRTALHYAAANGRLAAVRRLLKCGARVHAIDNEGNTPLHLAAANNQGAICQMLMYSGAGTARQRLDGSNALHVAALAGSTEACLAMLSLGEKAESITSAPKSKGAIQVDSDAPECVGINVRRGVEGNTSENTPLLCAAMGVAGTATSVYGWPSKREDVSLSSGTIFHVDTVRLLLLWGANVNIAGERGITLLHLVTSSRALFPVFREIVDEHMYALGLEVPSLMALQPPPVEPVPAESSELVAKAASKKQTKKDTPKEQKDSKGKKKTKSSKVQPKPPEEAPKNRALKAATQAVIAVNKLEELDAERKAMLHRMRWKRTLNVNGLNGDGNTALHVALYNNNRDAAMVFLLGFQCTCDLNSYLNDMRRVKNPLEEPPDCCCLSPPLNVNKANDYGFTPLHIAARHHDLDLIKHLLNRGANKNRLAMLSGGPLHLAVTVGGAPDIVHLFVSNGADVHLRNNQHGRTPLHVLCTDTARPWDDSNGCLRPLQPMLLAILNASDHAMDKDRQGRTPLALAVLSKRLLTVQLLLDHRRAEGSEDCSGITGITVKVGQRTSDVRKEDKQGRTPIHHACALAKLELLECVLNGNDAVVLEAASKARYDALTKKVEAAKAKKKNKNKGNKVEDSSEDAVEEVATDDVAESLTSRGALYAQDIKGNTVFHIAADMPREKPDAALEIMQELMNRITSQPPGITAWTQVMEEDDGEAEFVEPEDGYEEWPASRETEQTAWHRIVSHTLSTGEAASMAELQPGEEHPLSVTDVALQVLRVMLSNTQYAPKGKKPKRRKLDGVDIDGETCLQTALRLSNLPFVRCLLEFSESHDFGLNSRTIKHGRTALITAADMGLFDVVQTLLALGSRVNEGDRKGFTPLMAACRLGVGGRLDGLSFQARSRLAEDATGDSSVSGDQLEVDAEEEATKAALVDLLLNSEADPNRINDDADTALHFICEQASSPVQSLVVSRLITAGADPSKVNKRKDTPLHLAIENLEDGSSKSKTVLLALLDAKADYTVKNRKRRTPHELAVYLKKHTLAGIVAKYDEFAVKLETKKKKRR